jgi:hypothetical protein
MVVSCNLEIMDTLVHLKEIALQNYNSSKFIKFKIIFAQINSSQIVIFMQYRRAEPFIAICATRVFEIFDYFHILKVLTSSI